MSFRLAALAAIAPAFLLGACASQGPLNRSIPLAARDKMPSTEVVTLIPQNEVVVTIPVATGISAQSGVQFGLLGALVGSLVESGITASNAAAAETSVKPLRSALVDFDFDRNINSDIQGQLAQATWINPQDYRVVKDGTPQTLEGIVTGSKASGVLLNSVSYALNFNADELTVVMTSRLLPHSTDLKALLPGKADPKVSVIAPDNDLYHNVFTFTTAVPNATNNRDANIVLWSANSGAPMRDALKLGSTKLAELLVADLVADTPFDPKTTMLKPYQGELYAGYIVAKDDVGTSIVQHSGYQVYVTDVSQVALVNASQPKAKGR